MAAEPSARTPVVFEAIAIGAAISIAIGFASSQLFRILPPESYQDRIQLVIVAMSLIGVIGDVIGGFVAGWIARRDGWLHGLLANLAATVIGFTIGLVMTAMTPDVGFSHYLTFAFWATFIGWAALGLLLATGAGWLGAKLRGSRA